MNGQSLVPLGEVRGPVQVGNAVVVEVLDLRVRHFCGSAGMPSSFVTSRNCGTPSLSPSLRNTWTRDGPR